MLQKNNRFVLSFILPSLLLYCTFFIYPFLRAFYISLFRWRGIAADQMRFVGLDNFVRLFNDSVVYRSLLNNLVILVFGSIIIFTLSLLFSAVLARKNYREREFYRIVFFFPNTLSVVVVALIWRFVYNPSFGLLNEFLRAVGQGGLARAWLGTDATVMPAIVVSQAWMVIGFYMVLFLATMQNVPEDYYDAARIDGAGEFAQFLHVTVPLIWEVMRIALVFFVINAFRRSFPLVLVMTGGGPSRASEVLATYLYEQAFAHSNYGYGSAIGVFLFFVTFVLSAVVFFGTKRETYEY